MTNHNQESSLSLVLLDNNELHSSIPIRIEVKWNKQVFNITSLNLKSTTGRSLKEHIYTRISVPVDRQKIMVASVSGVPKHFLWKGILKDEFDFSSFPSQVTDSTSSTVVIKLTLIGSAEVLENPTEITHFLEDMTPEQQIANEQHAFQESLTQVTGMIPALQTVPQHRHDDSHKATDEIYPYNRLVHGLPQYQIETLLQQQFKEQPLVSSRSSTPRLNGKVAMTLGLELQRAYVNDLDVLTDGTLIGGLEDGHVQLWKHGQRILDLVHSPIGNNNSPRGVESVLALHPVSSSSSSSIILSTSGPAFATAGRGTLRVWNQEGHTLVSVRSPFPYQSFTGLVQVRLPPSTSSTHGHSLILFGLAARHVVTPPPSNRPRLIPQNEIERQRLSHIEAQEALVEQTMNTLRKTVSVWFLQEGTAAHHTDQQQSSSILPPLQHIRLEAPAPVSALESWIDDNYAFLAAGDEQGGIQIWKIITTSGTRLQFDAVQYYHLVPAAVDPTRWNRTNVVGVVCLKHYTHRSTRPQLLVSTETMLPESSSMVSSANVAYISIPTTASQAVHVLNIDPIASPPTVQVTLDGHKDIVTNLLPLTNGDLITTGGKMDGTMKLWSFVQLQKEEGRLEEVCTEPAVTNLCKDVGYVFSVVMLKDLKHDSSKQSSSGTLHGYIAIATARYNVIKLIV